MVWVVIMKIITYLDLLTDCATDCYQTILIAADDQKHNVTSAPNVYNIIKRINKLGINSSRQHFEIFFLFFMEKKNLTFHAKGLLRRQFA